MLCWPLAVPLLFTKGAIWAPDHLLAHGSIAWLTGFATTYTYCGANGVPLGLFLAGLGRSRLGECTKIVL